MLFLRINASFKLHLKRQLARLGVVNDGGPQHGSEPLPVPVSSTPRLIFFSLFIMLINEMLFCCLQAGGGGCGLLHREHSGSALSRAVGLKHA